MFHFFVASDVGGLEPVVWQCRSLIRRHPGPDPGSSAIKSLIAKDSFLTAQTRGLDAASGPA